MNTRLLSVLAWLSVALVVVAPAVCVVYLALSVPVERPLP